MKYNLKIGDIVYSEDLSFIYVVMNTNGMKIISINRNHSSTIFLIRHINLNIRMAYE